LQGYDGSLIQIENLVCDAETNTIRAAPPDSGTGAGFTNLMLIRSGYWEDTPQVFTGESIATLQSFSVIRFMGFLMTNSPAPEEVAALKKAGGDLGRIATGTLKFVADEYGLRPVTYQSGQPPATGR